MFKWLRELFRKLRYHQQWQKQLAASQERQAREDAEDRERWRNALYGSIPNRNSPVADEPLEQVLAAAEKPRAAIARRQAEAKNSSDLAESQLGVLKRCTVCGKPLTAASRDGKHRGC